MGANFYLGVDRVDVLQPPESRSSSSSAKEVGRSGTPRRSSVSLTNIPKWLEQGRKGSSGAELAMLDDGAWAA